LELLNIIKSRRSVRRFKDEKIPKERLMKILEAGIWAPSGSNIQPWEFILVTGNDTIEKIKLISPGRKNKAYLARIVRHTFGFDCSLY